MAQESQTALPSEKVDRVTIPFARFLRIEAAAGLLLFTTTVVALSLANSPWSKVYLSFWQVPVGLHIGPFDFSRSVQHWINDGLMTFFFFVVALELKRALALGELRNPRTAALPLSGAVGGMLVPMALYVALMVGRPGAHGWGTVMATDTAFAMGCLALFGARIPHSLRLFLLALAIFDDVGAIFVVAVGYGAALNWIALGLAVMGIIVIAGCAWVGIRSLLIYFLVGGAIWLCLDASGIHATIAGVVLGLMTPTRVWVNDAHLRAILGHLLSYPSGEHWSGEGEDRRDLRRAGRAVTESLSPVEQLEMMLHPWTGFVIMPVFALANAGVVFAGADLGQPVSVAIVVSLVLGKPVGVLVFTWLAVRFGAHRATDLTWPLLVAGAFLTGVGFTMSLFIAGLAFAPTLLSAAKIGILIASTISASAGVLMLVFVNYRNQIRNAPSL